MLLAFIQYNTNTCCNKALLVTTATNKATYFLRTLQNYYLELFLGTGL